MWVEIKVRQHLKNKILTTQKTSIKSQTDCCYECSEKVKKSPCLTYLFQTPLLLSMINQPPLVHVSRTFIFAYPKSLNTINKFASQSIQGIPLLGKMQISNLDFKSFLPLPTTPYSVHSRTPSKQIAFKSPIFPQTKLVKEKKIPVYSELYLLVSDNSLGQLMTIVKYKTKTSLQNCFASLLFKKRQEYYRKEHKYSCYLSLFSSFLQCNTTAEIKRSK